MSKTVSLDQDSAAFVESQVAEGRYRTADDVVRAGLRRLAEDEKKLAALRAALKQGEKGRATPFDFDKFLVRKNKEYKEKKAKVKAR